MSLEESIEAGRINSKILLESNIVVRIIVVYLWIYLFLTVVTLVIDIRGIFLYDFLRLFFSKYVAEITVSSIPAFLVIVGLEILIRKYKKREILINNEK
ncbi:hypothetical protein [Aliarcobacter butzleri]|uniref:hypothetical protein n=1 Tax=Aliarcobacter butzleri TaxID=28197 RepID=UPI00215A9DF3|nr:hypothetical protein [Aliarcobacter butzleri]MCR8710991.1 hypothetical protein [Aliarcobacter butzleri]